MSLLNKQIKLSIIISFLLVALAVVFMFFKSDTLFSPDGSSSSVDFDQLGLPGFIFKVEKFFFDRLDSELSTDFVERGSQPVCDSICKTFSSKKFKVSSPHKKGPIWWKDFYERPDVQEELNRLNSEVEAWKNQVSCPEGCEESGFTLDTVIHMQPVASTGSCSKAGESFSKHISVEGWARGPEEVSCPIAAISAAGKFKSALLSFLKSSCGEGCGYDLTISNFDYEVIFENSWDGCTVKIFADVEVTCTNPAINDEYWVWFDITACVLCRESGTVIKNPD